VPESESAEEHRSSVLGDATNDLNLRYMAMLLWAQRVPRAQAALSDAFLRVDRADEHVAVLRSEIQEWLSTADSGVQVEAHGGGRYARLIDRGTQGPPRKWSVIVGDAVHNLRAALDYSVYALAWMATGEHQEMTQFPIADSSESYRRQVRNRLTVLTDDQIEAMERIQPYVDGDWLALLRQLSNRDKHWALNLTLPHGRFEATFNYAALDETSDQNPTVEHEGGIELEFEDGKPVVATLEDLCGRTRTALEGLVHLFEPRTGFAVTDWVLIAMSPGPFSPAQMLRRHPFEPSPIWPSRA